MTIMTVTDHLIYTRANDSTALKIVYFLLYEHLSLLTIMQGTTN